MSGRRDSHPRSSAPETDGIAAILHPDILHFLALTSGIEPETPDPQSGVLNQLN